MPGTTSAGAPVVPAVPEIREVDVATERTLDDRLARALGPLAPEIEVQSRVETFAIDSATIDALQRLGARAPSLGVNRPRWAGMTRWRIHWTWDTFSSVNRCQFRAVDVLVDIQVDLPRLPDRAAADTSTSAWYAGWLDGLLAHEVEHSRLARDAAKAIHERIRFESEPSCAALALRANRDAESIVRAFNEKQAALDSSVAHAASYTGVATGSAPPMTPARAAIEERLRDAARPVPAWLTLTMRLEEYDVRGRRPVEVIESVASRCGTTADGRRWAGLMNARYTWDLALTREGDRCRVVDSQLGFEAAVQLPRLVGVDARDGDLIHWWRGTHQRLVNHEAGHVRIAITGMTELHDRMLALTAPTCEELPPLGDQLARARLAAIREQQATYDRSTDHGRLTPP